MVLETSKNQAKTGQGETELRNISYYQAKVEIRQYFNEHHGKEINPADIQGVLGIDVWMAIDICNELEGEGKIKGL